MTFITSSCGAERHELGITFVYDKPLGENQSGYPNYFKEIALPFNASCTEESKDFLPKPINVIRLDINKTEIETNAWYFESIGDNTIDFSTTWLEVYFKDSLPPAYLFEESKGIVSIESFIEKNKENTFIYSEESDLEEYEGVKVFSSTKKIAEEIKGKACKNTEGKVYVLVNPEMNEPPPIPSNGIASIFNEIGDKEVSPDIRLNIIDDKLKTFTEDSNVKEFGKNGTLVALTPIRDYLEKIAFYRTLEKIEVTDALKNPDGKYWEVSLVEHHLNDPQ